jgi:DNA-binding MarR family transcriptional regulator
MEKSDFDLNQQNENLESKIIAALERISQSFRVLLWDESKEYSLTPIQIQVLIFILTHSREKRKVSYLAKEFNMTKATISETIKILEQKQLISKEYESDDTRSFVINLTKIGKSIAEKSSLFSKVFYHPIQKMNQKDKEKFFFTF